MARKRAAQVTVNRSWCKQCGICIAFCPERVLEADERGYPVATNLAACTVCRLCELRCPDFAIEVAEEVHQRVNAAAHAG